MDARRKRVHRIGDDRGEARRREGNVLRSGLLHMTEAAVPWIEVAAKLKPFVARRVGAADVDDVLQEVLLRMHRGLGGLAEEERFTAWMYTIARNAITDHGRTRARHPIAEPNQQLAAAEEAEDDRVAARVLAGCLTVFIAHLPSPYREAVTLVELEGLTVREAAEAMAISVSGMKSRVQRGRAQLRQKLEECCAIAVDARGKVTEVSLRATCRPRACE
jgi:RNA polymerase sigma-70 factor (ECF subfamily)